jgi:hypothetical protein
MSDDRGQMTDDRRQITDEGRQGDAKPRMDTEEHGISRKMFLYKKGLIFVL